MKSTHGAGEEMRENCGGGKKLERTVPTHCSLAAHRPGRRGRGGSTEVRRVEVR
jgi:hypothetical protein